MHYIVVRMGRPSRDDSAKTPVLPPKRIPAKLARGSYQVVHAMVPQDPDDATVGYAPVVFV